MSATETWKVGRLAEASGLTVRTLHHWDEIGLLRPSVRTPGGHREYTEDDLGRLYLVLALRRLGLGLESIAVCLDAGVDPGRLVRDHLAGVEAELAALGALRERLVRLRDGLAADRTPDAADLLGALRATGGAGTEGREALSRYLDADQMVVLRARAEALGPAVHYLLEIEWPELYRRAERLRTEGVPPTDRRVRRLAARMDELSALFAGGDAAISRGVRSAWHDAPAAMSGTPEAQEPAVASAWRDLAAYLDQARERTV